MRGHNRWILARTDRDGATSAEVLETAGAFLSRVLGPASPSGQRSIFEPLNVPGKPARYIIGAARPVTVAASQPADVRAALGAVRPKGELIARWSDCPVLRTIEAQQPWIVTANFDWRAPDTRIPWPRRKVTALGTTSDDSYGLDWLLLGASHAGRAIQPDTTYADELSEAGARVVDDLSRGLGALLTIGAVVGAGALLWRYAPGVKRRRRRQPA